MLGNIFRAIGRMFTIPAKERAILKANPLTPLVQGALRSELSAVISSTVSKHVADPTLQSAVTTAIGSAVSGTGIFD